MELVAAKMAPPFRLVSKYIIASVFFYVILCVYIAISWQQIQGHFFQPLLLGLTHIATLGWINMIIFGAMFQLVPVLLEVPLWKVKLGEWQFWIYLVGVIGLVVGFLRFSVGAHLDASAALVTLAGYVFIWNMVRTMLTVQKWDITGFFLIAALIYFFITITLGLILTVNLGHPFIDRSHIDYLKIHAHFGLIGWASMVIMGVAMKLIPMFAISHNFSEKPVWFSFWFVNIGLLGSMVEKTFGETSVLFPLYSALVAIGLILYVVQIIIILKIRLRRTLDVAMKHAIVSFSSLFIITVLGFAAIYISVKSQMFEAVTLTYGFVALIGFISSLIVGEMYKIVPFLVWYNKYSSRAGIQTVPTLKEMIHEKLAQTEFIIFTGGFLTACVGLLVQVQIVFGIGAVLLAIASLLFGYNIIRSFTR